MLVKDVVMEDFVNYKEPSMFILTTKCNWKCCLEIGKMLCQNEPIAKLPNKEISNKFIIESYLNNPITKAVVIGGLEPFDTFDDTFQFIKEFRKKSKDTIIIYTGYYEYEIPDPVDQLRKYKNIIIKYGRFRPDQEPVLDPVLGVKLANKEQYAEKIS